MPQVSQTEIIGAYFTGIALVIAAIGNLIVGIINTKKLTEVHRVTNSGLTETKNDLKAANDSIVKLSSVVTQLRSNATIKEEVGKVMDARQDVHTPNGVQEE